MDVLYIRMGVLRKVQISRKPSHPATQPTYVGYGRELNTEETAELGPDAEDMESKVGNDTLLYKAGPAAVEYCAQSQFNWFRGWAPQGQ